MIWTEVNFPHPTDAAWGDMNKRRVELIRRNIYQKNLTPDELGELEVLQALSWKAVREAFPQPESIAPHLEEIEKALDHEVEEA